VTRRKLVVGSATLGLIGAVGVVIGFVCEPAQAAFSYLTGWAYAVSIALGALIFLMIGHATNARWVIAFRGLTEAIVSALPVLAVLFVPIALAMRQLYPWVAPSPTLDREVLAKLAHRAAYLDPTFFLVRAAAFFAVWIAFGELLRRLRGARARALSAAGLPAVALTLTFAAFDWLMSLTPNWYSTIFGLLYFSGGFVAALALLAVIARVAVVRAAIDAGHAGALGRLVFAFLVFWAYMEFSQGIIIWIANKPDEVPWYVARGAAAWGSVFALLVVGHFAVPFFVLLSRSFKRNASLLAIACSWLVAMHYADVYWIVMPVLHRTVAVHWLDFAAPAAVIGLATAFATLRTSSARLAEAS
jgi:hypothetical protein